MTQDYNKSYYEKMLLQMLEPTKAHFSPGKSRLELGSFAAGYGHRIAGMEGFSRILWGLVPYWAGGGEDRSLLPVIREGLCNGTDPDSEEYWGDLHDKDQRMVEMAAISNGLLLIPELLWEPLTERQKDNLADWLYQINLYSMAENNWQFFRTLTNLALKKLGRNYSPELVQEAIEKYESFYLGNGWYSDGKRPQKDYYVSFAIHYYCMLYAYYEKDTDPERSRLYRERAAAFAESFLYWFDDEGKALPFGRSLTYRFAEAAFFGAYVMTGVEGLSYGVLRGILGRHLRYWMKQPIFDNAGILTVGYTYPNLNMSEAYNAPGSPYWAMKTFAFLALPEGHPFWSAAEEPLPAREALHLIPEAQMLIQSRKGEVVAYTAGQYSVLPYTHDAEKYEKFAYSGRFGFSAPRSYCNINDCAPDSMLAFEIDNMIYVRRRCAEYELTDSQVWAKWSPYPGITVETTLVPMQRGHIRKHRIESNVECICYDCGFAYPYAPEETVTVADGNWAMVRDESGYSSILCINKPADYCVDVTADTCVDAATDACVDASTDTCAYHAMDACVAESTDAMGLGYIVNASPNTNLVFPLTRIPAVTCKVSKGVTEFETYIETGFIS